MLNTEVIKPLPFAKGFWLIASKSVLIEPAQNNAGRKKGQGSNKVKFIKPRPSQASIDANLNAIKNGNGLSSHDICELLNLSMSYVTRCLKVLKTEGAIQTSRYNKRKSHGTWFYYLIGELTEDQQTVSKPMAAVLRVIKGSPGIPGHEICKIARVTHYVMSGAVKKLEVANKITKEVWPINKGGHTIYAYTALKD
jgi:DNA-binding MarR family transcriptional regulator